MRISLVSLFVVSVGFLLLMGLVVHQLNALQKQRLMHAMPSFECTNLHLQTFRARWSWGGRQSAASAMHMDRACRASLHRAAEVDGFEKRWCGAGRLCWERVMNNQRYWIDIDDQNASFTYSEY